MRPYLYLSIVLFLIISCGNMDDPKVSDKPVINIESLTIEEGNGQHPVYLTARLDKASPDQVVVILQTEDINATAGEDYKALDNTPFTFEPGDVQNQLKIDILGDEAFEADESFLIRVIGSEQVQAGEEPAIITLLNDDRDTTLVIPASGYSSPESYPGMQMIWSDDFNAGEPIEDYWTFEYGGHGWGNNEWQYYRKENTRVHSGGYLVIEAREENYGGKQYTSSRIVTKNKFNFKYGRVDIRAVLPYGQGIWPALWMLGKNFSSVGWPACGEIDVMELIGNSPATTHGTIHWEKEGNHAQYSGSTTLANGIFNDEFHVFSLIWDEYHIEWLLDGKKFHEADIRPADLSEFHDEFFFIFNVAVGGNWPGYPDQTTEFPQRMIVDYIRVFQ